MRQFTVLKDTGDYWYMNYTSSGVSWVPVDGADASFDSDPTLSPAPPAVPAANTLDAGLNAVRAIGTLAPAISSVVQAAALTGLWWEDRQRRMLDEAKQEESRRIAWLADMTARWGEVHRSGDRLNFRVTEHLAREAKETMNALISNKRVSIPQSVLCEVGAIQDSLGSFRSLILAQFEEAASNGSVDLEAAVAEALPGRRLDMDFIRQLGQDPAAILDIPAKARVKDFDSGLPDFPNQAAGFTDRIFPSTLPAIPDPVEFSKPGLFEVLAEVVAGALAHLPSEEVNPDALERRTTFRELTLLPAEVVRVRALNSAWLAASAIVTERTGNEVTVRLGRRDVLVGLESNSARRELTSTSVGES